jgi:hypothetical protein
LRWALWSTFLGAVVAVAIALPLHYPYGFDTIGHLGLIYLDGLILLVGTVFAHNAINLTACPACRCFSEVSAERTYCSRFHMP